MIRKLAPCFFAIVIDALGFGLVYPVIATIFSGHVNPLIASDTPLALRHFYLSMAYLLYPLCMFFGAAFMGDLSDQWGRRKVLLLCMTGIGISFALMASAVIAKSIMLLLIGRALSGLMAGSQPIAQASIADLSVPETKVRNMSLISLSYSIGSVFGPFIGGALSDSALTPWFNFSTPFIVSAVFAFGAALWLFFAFQDTNTVKATRKVSFFRPIQIFAEAVQHPAVRYLAIVFLLMQIGFSIYFQFILLHMSASYHYNNLQLGSFQAMLGLGFAIGLLGGVPYSLKYGTEKSIAILALILTGATEIGSALISIQILQWILALLTGLFDIIAFAMLLTLFSNAVDQKAQGWVMGISSAVMAIAWVITGLSANALSFISPNLLILSGGMFLWLAAWLLWRNKQRLR